MAYRAYISTKGAKTTFPGTTKQSLKGADISTDQHSEILSVDYGVHATLHPQSGDPEGHRQHEPIRVLMAVDKNSPAYFKALCMGETLPKVEIVFTRKVAGDTSNERAMILTLENAHVKGFRFMTGRNQLEGNSGGSNNSIDRVHYDTRELVELTFQAQKVGFNTGNPDGNVGHVDDWHKPTQEA
jgi:type VI secretion system Hcp family effector